jgi:hypothetical protein
MNPKGQMQPGILAQFMPQSISTFIRVENGGLASVINIRSHCELEG